MLTLAVVLLTVSIQGIGYSQVPAEDIREYVVREIPLLDAPLSVGTVDFIRRE